MTRYPFVTRLIGVATSTDETQGQRKGRIVVADNNRMLSKVIPAQFDDGIIKYHNEDIKSRILAFGEDET